MKNMEFNIVVTLVRGGEAEEQDQKGAQKCFKGTGISCTEGQVDMVGFFTLFLIPYIYTYSVL